MKRGLQLFSSIALAVVLAFLPQRAKAQDVPLLPIDTAMYIGHLDNGLTYIIRENKHPKGRADFYIAQKVGSILEEDSQSGLAHFLEHMAFNGTKNFPDKGIISYLETLGMTFGSEINASTGFDQTVYTLINAPVERRATVDSCLLILHDWSNAITLADKEIDAERGVIEEEWRSRNSAGLRISIEEVKQLIPQSKYVKRLPIGDMEVVRNFKYKELRDYYKKWYRPDLQAIIISGDVNRAEVEQSIKKIFADIPKPINPAKRVYQPRYPKQEGTIVSVATDPEYGHTSMTIAFRRKPFPKKWKRTEKAYERNVKYGYISSIIGERFADIMHKPNPPYLHAGYGRSSWGDLLPDDSADAFYVSVKAGELRKGLFALVREMKKLKEFGFTEAELERARKDKLTANEQYLKNRKDWSNSTYAQMGVDYFLNDGNDAFCIQDSVDYRTSKKYATKITLADINAEIREALSSAEVALSYTGPQNDSIHTPSKAELLEMYQEAMKQEVKANKQEEQELVLMKHKPKAGKIVKEKKGKFGSTIWKLSNGARVIFKKTDFEADNISMSAVRRGGILPYIGKEKNVTIRGLGSCLNMGGLAEYNSIELSKVLSGHQAWASLSDGIGDEGLSASCINDDMETMFQLIYLNMTAKRSDSIAFENWRKQTIVSIEQAKTHPTRGFSDSINKIVNPPEFYDLTRTSTIEEVKSIDYKQVIELRKKMFSGVNGMTFFFIGTIDMAKFRPLVEQYIASLPRGRKPHKVPYKLIQPTPKGQFIKHFQNPMETPKTYIYDCYTAKFKSSRRNKLLAQILGEVLEQSYTESIREREGGTYGVSVSTGLSHYPKNQLSLTISFETAPEKAEHLNKLVKSELLRINKEGIKQELFDKSIKSWHKYHEERLRKNSYWIGLLMSYYSPKPIDLRFLKRDFDKVVDGIKKKEVEKLLKELVKQNNYIEVVLSPKAMPTKK